jgi:hypothetical protein
MWERGFPSVPILIVSLNDRYGEIHGVWYDYTYGTTSQYTTSTIGLVDVVCPDVSLPRHLKKWEQVS